MDTSQYLVIFFQILGSLALLIYGMKVMSEALQKTSSLSGRRAVRRLISLFG